MDGRKLWVLVVLSAHLSVELLGTSLSRVGAADKRRLLVLELCGAAQPNRCGGPASTASAVFGSS